MSSSTKKGFTLIELMVVIALASVLLMVTANFLIFAIQRNNSASIENEVRNEANSLLDTIGKDVRNSSCEVMPDSSQIYLYGNQNCAIGVGPTPYAIYSIDPDPTKRALLRNGLKLSSDSVKVQNCTTCSCAVVTDSGFLITKSSPSVRSYSFQLTLRQGKDNPRSDFCGRVQVKQTFVPRNN
jgi:prepilin-type N-terminal cleavage/methylation domain-containing protein